MNPYAAEELGRQHRSDLDREADRARIVAVARAGTERSPVNGPWRSLLAWIGRRRREATTGQPVASLARSDVATLIHELRSTRQQLADLERALVSQSRR